MKTLTNDQLISNNTDDYDDNDDDDERRSPLCQENKIQKTAYVRVSLSFVKLFISCALNCSMLRFAGLFWSNL